MKIGSSELTGEKTLASTSASERANDTPPLYSVMNGTPFDQVGPVLTNKMEHGTTQASETTGDKRKGCKQILELFALVGGAVIFLYLVYWLKHNIDWEVAEQKHDLSSSKASGENQNLTDTTYK